MHYAAAERAGLIRGGWLPRARTTVAAAATGPRCGGAAAVAVLLCRCSLP